MKANNLKALTVAVALAASSSASAVIDVATATTAPVNYADELKTLNTDGRVVVTNAATELDVKGTALFATPTATTRYFRFDLTGALFDDTPVLKVDDSTSATVGAAEATETLLSGGDDNTYAIFSVTPASTKTIEVGEQWLLQVPSFQIDPTVTSTISYKMFETAGDATNAAQPLASATSNLAAFIAGSAASAAINKADLTATVASGFGEFAAPANISATASGSLGSLGLLDVSDVVGATATLTAAGATTNAASYLTAAQNIVITGDVSVGTFTSQTGADCTGGTIACTKATDNASCTIAATAAQADMYFCVTLAADDVISKGSYSAAAATDTGVAGALGSVKYDTTTVEVPYITTYEGYNQRLFIDNRGSTAAYYSTTFTSESGVTATAGASGTGTLPANTMSAVKVADLVTLTGGSRGSATMEIEAQSGSIFVTSQIVDLGTGVTDTQSLHPADNSVGSCTHAVTNPAAATTLVAAAGFDADGDSSVTVTATPAAGDEVGATATAMSSRYAYATSTCTD